MTMRLRTVRFAAGGRRPPEQSSHLVFIRTHVAWGHHGGTGTGTGSARRTGRRGEEAASAADGDPEPAGYRRAVVVRGALRGSGRPAGQRAAGAAGAADQDHRAVETGRIRGYRPARAGSEVVLADPGRYGRDRAGGRCGPTRPGPGGTPSGGCGPGTGCRAPGTCRTPRCTGRASRAARTPTRCGRWRWS